MRYVRKFAFIYTCLALYIISVVRATADVYRGDGYIIYRSEQIKNIYIHKVPRVVFVRLTSIASLLGANAFMLFNFREYLILEDVLMVYDILIELRKNPIL